MAMQCSTAQRMASEHAAVCVCVGGTHSTFGLSRYDTSSCLLSATQ
jgi:hypothetical protein